MEKVFLNPQSILSGISMFYVEGLMYKVSKKEIVNTLITRRIMSEGSLKTSRRGRKLIGVLSEQVLVLFATFWNAKTVSHVGYLANTLRYYKVF